MASESEKRPLGMMVPPVPAGTEIPPEPPDVGARALAMAARLLAGATIFFFLAFLFAYFYLRSINQQGLWRHGHLNPDHALGAAMIACVIASAVLAVVAGLRMRGGARGWTGWVLGAVLLGLAAVALQCIEYTKQNFGPTDGAFASVFCVWTALYLIAVLGTMYWLETQLATELRLRRQPASRRDGDILAPDQLIAPGLDAAVFYWSFLAATGVVMYVVLYLL